MKQFNCNALSGLEACAEPQCFEFFSLTRLPGGRVECVQVRAAGRGIQPPRQAPHSHTSIGLPGRCRVLQLRFGYRTRACITQCLPYCS